ncbi:hypothetical protein E1A91_A12G120700v1 [Gossypium mustelinum]|uniref:Uncharacterized protein n=1 Tax=Gossypium mustelinum TaxID=34275 RepID=A0A5D2WTP9_GOSMU|nr:hypothetical protein E1A91_A12G120700v1 [Gossypium mustelinum]
MHELHRRQNKYITFVTPLILILASIFRICCCF